MKVSILQWNILYEENIKNIIAFLRKNKADIICLQELSLDSPIQNNIDTPKYVAQALGYSYYYRRIPVYASKELKVLANGIFSRFPIASSRSDWIQKPAQRSSDYSYQHRAYVEVRLKVGKDILDVGTTHTSYTHHFINTARKRQEARKLIKLIENKRTKFILTGDLNSRPNSYTLKSLRKHFKHAGPAYSQKTFTTKYFTYKGFKETGLNWRLDYVFTTEDVKVLNSKILKTKYSDHLPILTTIEI